MAVNARDIPLYGCHFVSFENRYPPKMMPICPITIMARICGMKCKNSFRLTVLIEAMTIKIVPKMAILEAFALSIIFSS